eukprot:TRINITY_DN1720_c0_g1_i1.p1 TRINITY_DN1720_c0_g1~~TRINITY_DN1720_c0_g1_i1.p1  ORF type:complete len:125 (-),score=23.13 TRINITY_DN1720_c0_g1_i1:70-423(-)
MGKRKGRKKPTGNFKPRDPGLPTTFTCPNCDQPNAVECTLNKNDNIGRLKCRSCDMKYQTEITPLSHAVDVFNSWIDEWEAVNQGGATENQDEYQEQYEQDVPQEDEAVEDNDENDE